jgi:hypothetical protein
MKSYQSQFELRYQDVFILVLSAPNPQDITVGEFAQLMGLNGRERASYFKQLTQFQRLGLPAEYRNLTENILLSAEERNELTRLMPMQRQWMLRHYQQKQRGLLRQLTSMLGDDASYKPYSQLAAKHYHSVAERLSQYPLRKGMRSLPKLGVQSVAIERKRLTVSTTKVSSATIRSILLGSSFGMVAGNSIDKSLPDKPIEFLVPQDDIDFIRYLINKRLPYPADRNINKVEQRWAGLTILQVFSGFEYPGFLAYLIENNADVNQYGKNGVTAIGVAVANRCLNNLNFLLEHGARVTMLQGVEKQTLLHYAAEKNDVAIMRRLLAEPSLKAMIDSGDSLDRETALMHASARDHADIVRLLLDASADLDMMSVEGCTALCYAVFYKASQCVDLLLAYGADVDMAMVSLRNFVNAGHVVNPVIMQRLQLAQKNQRDKSGDEVVISGGKTQARITSDAVECAALAQGKAMLIPAMSGAEQLLPCGAESNQNVYNYGAILMIASGSAMLILLIMGYREAMSAECVRKQAESAPVRMRAVKNKRQEKIKISLPELKKEKSFVEIKADLNKAFEDLQRSIKKSFVAKSAIVARINEVEDLFDRNDKQGVYRDNLLSEKFKKKRDVGLKQAHDYYEQLDKLGENLNIRLEKLRACYETITDIHELMRASPDLIAQIEGSHLLYCQTIESLREHAPKLEEHAQLENTRLTRKSPSVDRIRRVQEWAVHRHERAAEKWEEKILQRMKAIEQALARLTNPVVPAVSSSRLVKDKLLSAPKHEVKSLSLGSQTLAVRDYSGDYKKLVAVGEKAKQALDEKANCLPAMLLNHARLYYIYQIVERAQHLTVVHTLVHKLLNTARNNLAHHFFYTDLDKNNIEIAEILRELIDILNSKVMPQQWQENQFNNVAPLKMLCMDHSAHTPDIDMLAAQFEKINNNIKAVVLTEETPFYLLYRSAGSFAKMLYGTALSDVSKLHPERGERYWAGHATLMGEARRMRHSRISYLDEQGVSLVRPSIQPRWV